MSAPIRSPYVEAFRSPRLGAVLAFGFSSGLPLALTSGTLQAWLAADGVAIETIAWFSWIALPYALKFLWSPLLDRFAAPLLGRRRGWMLIAQGALVVGIALMGTLAPDSHLVLLGAIALAVAFASATQDIVVDAYRTDLLPAAERGAGAALGVLGYRVAMLVSGGLALVMADVLGFRIAYFSMAAVMAATMLATLAAPEPQTPARLPQTLGDTVLVSLRDLFARPRAAEMLALVALYKFGDALAATLSTAFLIRGVGFSLTEVGLLNKWLGFAATVAGGLAGAALMVRLGLLRALFVFGVLQAVSTLAFALLAWAGKSYALLVFAVGFENLASGMGTAAFVALLMALCDRRFSATQYALLSAIASLGRVLFGPAAGALVAAAGWGGFFAIASLAALPGLALLARLSVAIASLERQAPPAPA